MRLGTAHKTALAVLSVFSVLLVANNPTMADYENRWANAYDQEIKQADAFTKLLAGVANALGAKKMALSMVQEGTTRTNWLLFSVYTTCLGLEEKQYRFLGFMGSFFQVSQQQATC